MNRLRPQQSVQGATHHVFFFMNTLQTTKYCFALLLFVSFVLSCPYARGMSWCVDGLVAKGGELGITVCVWNIFTQAYFSVPKKCMRGDEASGMGQECVEEK
eukprot:m.79340 g.79340  ORF g.79340 m.79340 type:complete len:102 (+) comp16268_c0_seq4:3469-3774(+)